VTISGSGSVTDLNFGTLRARAGWALGNFLPYAFTGVAVGHANVNIAGTVFGQENPQNQPCTPSGPATPACVPFSFTGTAGKNGEWMWSASHSAAASTSRSRATSSCAIRICALCADRESRRGRQYRPWQLILKDIPRPPNTASRED
jgi:opacity protein-like surface antigen